MSHLAELGIALLPIEWADVMLSSRIINSSIGGVFRQEISDHGGCLSRLPWLLVINDVLIDREHNGTKVWAYTDNVVLFIAGRSLRTISDLIQGDLVKQSRSARGNGLAVNPYKIELVHFTRKRKLWMLSH